MKHQREAEKHSVLRMERKIYRRNGEMSETGNGGIFCGDSLSNSTEDKAKLDVQK